MLIYVNTNLDKNLLKIDKKVLNFNIASGMIEKIKENNRKVSPEWRNDMRKETVAVITKYLLDIMFFAGIAVTVTLPWLVKLVTAYFHFEDFEGRYVEIVSIYFVLGILAVLILGELRKMFRTVLKNDCFVRENVVSLQRMGTYSFIIAAVCLLRSVLYTTAAMLVLVLVFVIAGLFSKVLAFVFDEAVDYKIENDLTI